MKKVIHGKQDVAGLEMQRCKVVSTRELGLFITIMGAVGCVIAEPIQLPSGIDFTPAASIDISYDDNITSASSAQIQSWVLKGRTNFLLEAKKNNDEYRVEYAVENGTYLSSTRDNYVDHELGAGAKWELNERKRVTMDGNLRFGHDERGSEFSKGFGAQLSKPDTYVEADIIALYRYGAESSRFKVETKLGGDIIDYYGGLRTHHRDRNSGLGQVSLFIKSGAKTHIVTEVSHRKINYPDVQLGQPTLNSRETDFLAGIDWTTPKTELSMRGGVREKYFESDLRRDYTGSRWDVSVRWKPRTYSRLTLTTARRTEEVQGLGDFIDVKIHSLGWHHDWSGRLSSETIIGVESQDYQGGDGNFRQEDLSTANAKINYQMRRWLSIHAGFKRNRQEAADFTLDYERNITYVGFELSL